MAYEKLNLSNGTVLNEEHLAHIEAGIENSGGIGKVGAGCSASGEYAHAEGTNTRASGGRSHAEGASCEATGHNSHAEGQSCVASGGASHAEGSHTTASGMFAHSEGSDTIASDYNSHAEGVKTVAASNAQHVQGRHNIEDAEDRYAHIVGNGEPYGDPSNAHTLDWAGVPWYAGDRVMLGGTGMDDEAAVALMPVFVPQELTEDQKLQARTNIGAMAKGDTEVKVSSKAYLNSYKIVVTVNGVESEGPAMSLVRYDVNQTGLTEEQKAQARANIGVDAYIEQVFLGGEW